MSQGISSPNPELIACMKADGVIPVFQHNDLETILRVLKISSRCGAHTFEFTHHRDSRFLYFFETLAETARELPDMIVGAGTVLDARAAKQYIRAGARFIVSPFLHPETAELCEEHQVIWIPGCNSKLDVLHAKMLGAQAVTILSGALSKPDFVQAIADEIPGIGLIPSWGIRIPENRLKSWFDAGSLCIRLGEALFAKEVIAVRDWSRLEATLFSTLHDIRQTKALTRKKIHSIL